jgi:hypothetical protein
MSPLDIYQCGAVEVAVLVPVYYFVVHCWCGTILSDDFLGGAVIYALVGLAAGFLWPIVTSGLAIWGLSVAVRRIKKGGAR